MEKNGVPNPEKNEQFTHFWWETWANRSQSLICLERPERFAHSCSFPLCRSRSSVVWTPNGKFYILYCNYLSFLSTSTALSKLSVFAVFDFLQQYGKPLRARLRYSENSDHCIKFTKWNFKHKPPRPLIPPFLSIVAGFFLSLHAVVCILLSHTKQYFSLHRTIASVRGMPKSLSILQSGPKVGMRHQPCTCDYNCSIFELTFVFNNI